MLTVTILQKNISDTHARISQIDLFASEKFQVV